MLVLKKIQRENSIILISKKSKKEESKKVKWKWKKKFKEI